jgi:hypothetical protein
MNTFYKYTEIEKLWQVIGEIGTRASREDDESLAKLYSKLSTALDYCEDVNLIAYKED